MIAMSNPLFMTGALGSSGSRRSKGRIISSRSRSRSISSSSHIVASSSHSTCRAPAIDKGVSVVLQSCGCGCGDGSGSRANHKSCWQRHRAEENHSHYYHDHTCQCVPLSVLDKNQPETVAAVRHTQRLAG